LLALVGPVELGYPPAQGYFYSQPVPATEVSRLLERNRPTSAAAA